MTEAPALLPHCPVCGSEGPTRGTAYCDVCGTLVDWSRQVAEQARTNGPDPGGSAGAPPSGVEPPTPPASGPSSGDAQRRARELLVPLADRPAPVLPGQPEPERPEVKPVLAAAESGVDCWRCGVGNNRERHFCRSCGADLTRAPVSAVPLRASRGQRLRAWLRRRWWVLAGILVALLAVAVVAALLVPRLLARDEVVPPAVVTASNEDPAHPATNMFDQNADTWWGTGQAGRSTGVSVTASFRRPVELRALQIVPGVSDRPADRPQQNRPQRVSLRAVDKEGRTTELAVRLDDIGPQRIRLNLHDVTRVTLTIQDAYVTDPTHEVAVAEVTLLGRG